MSVVLAWLLERLPASTDAWTCPWFVLICVISSATLGVFVAGGQAVGSAVTAFAFGWVVGTRRPGETCQT